MRDSAAPKIVIVGCGNVAWHLARKFSELKFSVVVYNHRVNVALEDFRKQLKVSVKVGLFNIDDDAAFYFICVPDRYIGDCAKRIGPKSPRAVIAHTSGSAEIRELGKRGHGTAVFYPLQTFSRNDEVVWQKVPLIIEGDSAATTAQVKMLADHFSKEVHICNYEERLKLHLAAVLVNNFTNALFVSASRLLGEGSTSDKFRLLMPLAAQTVEKVRKMDPVLAQTGPARRGDKKVMKKHLKLLAGQDEMRRLYKQMSALITEQQQR
jgi:predicted short-subunit dehydrogenase-like oxidoreductase (DUF2520 family)